MNAALLAALSTGAVCGLSYLVLQGRCLGRGGTGSKKPLFRISGSNASGADEFEAFRNKVPLHEFILKEDGVVTYLMCCDHCLRPMRGQNARPVIGDCLLNDSSLTAKIMIYSKEDFSREAVKELHLCRRCRSEFMGFFRGYLHLDDCIPISSLCFDDEKEQRTLDSGSIGGNAADISGSL